MEIDVRTIVHHVLLITVTICLVYDVIVFSMSRSDLTLSYILRDLFMQEPLVAVLVGFFLGHILLPIGK